MDASEKQYETARRALHDAMDGPNPATATATAGGLRRNRLRLRTDVRAADATPTEAASTEEVEEAAPAGELQQSWLLILGLILLAPIFLLYLIWRRTSWTTSVKTASTVGLVLLLIAMINAVSVKQPDVITAQPPEVLSLADTSLPSPVDDRSSDAAELLAAKEALGTAWSHAEQALTAATDPTVGGRSDQLRALLANCDPALNALAAAQIQTCADDIADSAASLDAAVVEAEVIAANAALGAAWAHAEQALSAAGANPSLNGQSDQLRTLMSSCSTNQIALTAAQIQTCAGDIEGGAASLDTAVATTPMPFVGPADPPSPSVYYKNCDAARAAGAAPLYRGEPGYASHLDRDNDGIACE